MQEYDTYKGLLHSNGLKNTKRRNLILDILAQTEQPLTVDQIFLELKQKDISINISTVYRIVETMVSRDLVIKTNLNGESKTFFELNRKEHGHHIICMNCKQMFWLDDCPLDDYCDLLQEKTGFDITGHKLEIYGYCQKCK
ncbi:MAG TPA: Fur family transcriptional regulator [Syntrophomonadaceae bacterium]|nr:Fur family transcriptional regulator [Syntrophomonadaceae bacterium]HNX29742.1 Fur family transcriptional regulator [Syntrophomonadaceae bacterium]HPR94216.1 Fur family transcriptional regulator [Syntrophomonadaceae bacterium]